MKTSALIAMLQKLPGNSTPYVRIIDPVTEQPVLAAIAGVDPANSPEYGSAVIIELED